MLQTLHGVSNQGCSGDGLVILPILSNCVNPQIVLPHQATTISFPDTHESLWHHLYEYLSIWCNKDLNVYKDIGLKKAHPHSSKSLCQ